MGTVFSLSVHPPGVHEDDVEDVMSWLHWVDTTFSTYRPDSQISRLGRGDISLQECAPEVREVLTLCEQWRQATNGYFSAYPAGPLDPSGAVKGWAIEQASDRLRAAGSTNHCVNGGGDVQCAGNSAQHRPWRIGITNPLVANSLATVVTGRDIAVATSGTAERGDHIVDPHTRRAPSGLASITLVGRHLTEVDAYATAAFAMGARAREWLEQMPDVHAFAVSVDGSTWTTKAFPASSCVDQQSG